MRVTNTMLKQASLSSGLPLAHSTLLDHLNNDSNDLMANALKSRNQIMRQRILTVPQPGTVLPAIVITIQATGMISGGDMEKIIR